MYWFVFEQIVRVAVAVGVSVMLNGGYNMAIVQPFGFYVLGYIIVYHWHGQLHFLLIHVSNLGSDEDRRN